MAFPNHTWLGRQRGLVVRDLVPYIVYALMFVVVYHHNSVMGEDGERAALDRVRNSSGYLIKYYGQEN